MSDSNDTHTHTESYIPLIPFLCTVWKYLSPATISLCTRNSILILYSTPSLRTIGLSLNFVRSPANCRIIHTTAVTLYRSLVSYTPVCICNTENMGVAWGRGYIIIINLPVRSSSISGWPSTTNAIFFRRTLLPPSSAGY